MDGENFMDKPMNKWDDLGIFPPNFGSTPFWVGAKVVGSMMIFDVQCLEMFNPIWLIFNWVVKNWQLDMYHSYTRYRPANEQDMTIFPNDRANEHLLRALSASQLMRCFFPGSTKQTIHDIHVFRISFTKQWFSNITAPFFKGFRNINDKKTPTRKTKQKDSGFSRCLYFAKMSWGESGEFALSWWKGTTNTSFVRCKFSGEINSHQNVEVVQRSSEIQKSRRHVILFGSDRSDQLCKIQILVVVSKFLYEPILRILCTWVSKYQLETCRLSNVCVLLVWSCWEKLHS